MVVVHREEEESNKMADLGFGIADLEIRNRISEIRNLKKSKLSFKSL